MFRLDAEAGLRLIFSTANPEFADRFAFLTAEELSGAKRERLRELDILASLALLTAVEAKFRVDFHTRVVLKKKGALSRRFQKIFGRSNKTRLEEDILDTWKAEHPEHREAIREVKGALKYRHWLAHGRYWDPSLARISYDFDAVYAVALLVEQMPMLDFQ
ncbi:MAG: hypothetical protein JWR84_1066 [Caulobacter sp.]|nr:hypothetical protein [Caulobacter sp.]